LVAQNDQKSTTTKGERGKNEHPLGKQKRETEKQRKVRFSDRCTPNAGGEKQGKEEVEKLQKAKGVARVAEGTSKKGEVCGAGQGGILPGRKFQAIKKRAPILGHKKDGASRPTGGYGCRRKRATEKGNRHKEKNATKSVVTNQSLHRVREEGAQNDESTSVWNPRKHRTEKVKRGLTLKSFTRAVKNGQGNPKRFVQMAHFKSQKEGTQKLSSCLQSRRRNENKREGKGVTEID